MTPFAEIRIFEYQNIALKQFERRTTNIDAVFANAPEQINTWTKSTVGMDTNRTSQKYAQGFGLIV